MLQHNTYNRFFVLSIKKSSLKETITHCAAKRDANRFTPVIITFCFACNVAVLACLTTLLPEVDRLFTTNFPFQAIKALLWSELGWQLAFSLKPSALCSYAKLCHNKENDRFAGSKVYSF